MICPTGKKQDLPPGRSCFLQRFLLIGGSSISLQQGGEPKIAETRDPVTRDVNRVIDQDPDRNRRTLSAPKKERVSQKRLLQEIKAKGQGTAYADLERQYKELEKTHKEYVESRSKTDSQLHRDLYRQNMAVRLLAREVQKHDPNFNFWSWADEHLGKD